MKNYILIIFSLILVSCGSETLEDKVNLAIETENTEKLKRLKRELKEQRKTLDNLSTQIQEALSDKGDQLSNYTLITAKRIQKDTFNHFFTLQGNVQTNQNILIYPEFSGELQKIYVKEGDVVQKGQILAEIDHGGLSDQIQELKTRTQLTKTIFERRKSLWKDSIGSEIQYLEAKTNYESSLSALNNLYEKYKKVKIKAPFSGTIDNIITDEGQIVAPGGMAIFRLVNLDKMYIETEVPENYLDDIKIGTPVEVRLGAINKTFKAQIDQMANYINPDNRKFMVKIHVPEHIENVKPNLIANVLINDYINPETIIVSENVLQETANGSQVTFTVKMQNDSVGKAIRTPIKAGKIYNGRVEVIEGLKENDIIAKEGGRTLRDQEDVIITTLEQ
ncbi:efflux RND transporter periplasmic adaptor subunit [Mesohalobacter halotolerans]|uniref:Efflux RND transporter periplasmic adaptor subunit n=1 Tax=Mesohalobacter halotolerans TaxID=1883405 RepID=A0A4U5TU81_9FLAO|nr:efflux RND transporter periplasmic adaptor subunit [Mesohalobacter halotolerans]TKS57054.1 efflux RND transporter periplasmic adaptor subunit [Mesohalobacter halotolerans]